MHPKFLYHYTSIQLLALILNTKKIRFNRLDKVDDLSEAKSADLGNLGRFYFVSCWSDTAEESIPFWSMYTPNMTGVKIKLPSDMFKEYIIKPQSDGFIHVKTEINSPLPYNRMITDKYTVGPTIWNPAMFLRNVEYTNDKSKLYPNVRKKEDKVIAMILGHHLEYVKGLNGSFKMNGGIYFIFYLNHYFILR